MNEKIPKNSKNNAREVTKEAIASPLPDFASGSVGESCGAGDACPDGMNSLMLCLVNYCGFDPEVAECAVVLCKVEDDLNNNPSDKNDAV